MRLRLCILLLSCSCDAALRAQTWDAAGDFSPDNNPNGPWSYHNGFTAENAADGIEPRGLLLQNSGVGCGGSPGGWSLSGDGSCPNLFAERWSTNSVQIVGCELGGHGPWMVQWTSPVAGEVVVRYTLLQLFEPDRRMIAEIQHNGKRVDRLLMPEHANGRTKLTHERADSPESPGTRTNMAIGEMIISVAEGDTLSYVAGGGTPDVGGNCADTFVYASFTIVLGGPAAPCQENCTNGIDDDEDGNVDCMDEECGCSTLDDDSFDVVFPNVFELPADRTSKLRIGPIGVSAPGHITASEWRPEECPVFFGPAKPTDECPPNAPRAPLDFSGTCWAVDSVAKFDSATVTIEAHLSKLNVTATKADAALIVSLDQDGNLTALPVESRSVESVGSIWVVVVSSALPEIDDLTFALVDPTAFLESHCTDGIDNDEDGNSDCDDANCAPTPDCVCPEIPQTYYRFEDDLVDAISGDTHGTTDAVFSEDVPDARISKEANTRALSFSNGTAARFDGSRFVFHNQCDATLEFFIKPAEQQHVAVFWTQDGGGDDDRYNIHFQTQGLGADYREAGGTLHSVLDGDIPLPIDTWSHVACVRTLLGDGSHQYEWYVNRELADRAVDSRPLPPTSSTWTISGRNGCCNEFTGLLDEIRMTARALRPDEFLRAGPEGVGPFLRGDCDGNGRVGGSPTEAIVLLLWAFRGADAPPCIAACDVNLDGAAAGSPTDAVLILTFSFLGGEPPPPPFPACDVSTLETDAMLGCEQPRCVD